jgi:hypothetical protein
MTGQPPPLVQKFLDKLSKSRDLSISLVVHALLIAIFGTAILFKVVPEKPEFISSENNFVSKTEPISKPKEPTPDLTVPPTTFTTQGPANTPTETFDVIKTSAPNLLVINQGVTKVDAATVSDPAKLPPPRDVTYADGLTPEVKQAIKDFSEVWKGSKDGSRKIEYDFTAYIGQYQGGNWNSTVRMSQGKIETGSLPNLLYLMSHWTKDRVRTNYRNVQAIRLDSDELFSVKPPFIFLSGTRDFTLTEKEVENLRKYLRVGGCVWGDSSVPGKNSRFDIAFKREMRRVVGGDQDFEPLPAGHPLFSQAYFKDVRSVPAGLNSYQLPVTALKMFGEVSVIYTANDYGDMWQIGLDASGKIDLRRNAAGQPIAINESLYAQRDVYVRNISEESLETSFKFGANVVMHLLTRWQNRVGSSSAL